MAALRYNENSDRPMLTDAHGQNKLRVEYKKFMSGQGRAKEVRGKLTSGNIELSENIFIVRK